MEYVDHFGNNNGMQHSWKVILHGIYNNICFGCNKAHCLDLVIYCTWIDGRLSKCFQIVLQLPYIGKEYSFMLYKQFTMMLLWQYLYNNCTSVVCECHRNKRDREPSRIPVKKLHRLSKKNRNLQCYVWYRVYLKTYRNYQKVNVLFRVLKQE